MRRNIKLLLFQTLICFNSFTQELSTYVDNSKTANELCVALKGNSFSTEDDANKALDDIISVIGVSRNFILKPCENISNAMAISLKGIRYVFYNKEFMREINTNVKYWGNMSILAHEIGHHINGHTIDVILYASESVEEESLATSRMMELQADEFSGFVLAKLGATLSQASEAISKFIPDEDDTYSTHPTKSKRLKAIKRGYDKAKFQDEELIHSSSKNQPMKTETITKIIEKTVHDTILVYDTVKINTLQDDTKGRVDNANVERESIATVKDIYKEKASTDKELSEKYFVEALQILKKINNFPRMSRSSRHEMRSNVEALLDKSQELDSNNADIYIYRGLNLLDAFFEGHRNSDETWQKRGCDYLKRAVQLGSEEAQDDIDFYCF